MISWTEKKLNVLATIQISGSVMCTKKVALAYNIFLLLSILQVHVRAHFLVLNQANYEEKKKKKNSRETQWLEIKRTGYRNGKRVLPFVAPLFRDLHILLSHQTIIPRFNISLLMDILRAQFSQNKPRSILYWFCVAKQLNGPNKFIPNNLPSDMNFYHFLTFKYIHHYLTR